MSSRSSHVRTKVVALLVSLVALWAFAATVTMREGLNLLYVNTITQSVGKPAEALLDALAQERRASVVYLGAGRPGDQRPALADARAATDAALAAFQRLSSGGDVSMAASAALRQRIAQATSAVGALPGQRTAIDAGTEDREGAASAYTDMIAAGFRMYGAISTLDDQEIAKESRTLVQLSQARELLAQEDTLLAGVLAAGRFSGTEPERFIQLVGTQRYLYATASAELPDADQADFRKLSAGDALTRVRAMEDDLVAHARAGGVPTVTASAWQDATSRAFAGLRDLELSAADHTLVRAEPAAAWVIVRLVLAGGLGLLAVLASIVISITTARSLVRQLDRLRTAAWQLATERLPDVVERLRRGEEVDVSAEAPPLEFGNDEIGQVGQAFNAVQRTAIRTAVEQAELRRSVRDVFLSLARRSQALVHRQLSLLDTMERKETDAEELEELFRVDHLATRMRRNAENLIVLSGAAAGRGWRYPVPMIDVIRGAVAEVEDYLRVTVLPIDPAALAGRAVGDVIHLLAELIENAVSFSPPYTEVQVSGRLVANGFAVEIEDRGLGMSEPDLREANVQLDHAPEFNLSSTARLGLYVVGRLADRHGVAVRLRESPYGGTTAIVLIPGGLVVAAEEGEPQHGRHARLRAALGGGLPTVDGALADTPVADAAASAVAHALTPDADAAPPAVAVEEDPDPAVPAVGRFAVPGPDASGDDRAGDDRVGGDRVGDDAAVPLPRRSGVAIFGRRGEHARPPTLPVRTPGATRAAHGGRPPTDPSRQPLPAGDDPGAVTLPARQAVTGVTPAGLPWRVRQANLAAPLRDAAAPPDGTGQPAREPDEIRQMMASFQTGTRRGRAEPVPQPDAPDAAADGQQTPSEQGEGEH